MKSTKITIGIIGFIIFCVGAGLIIARNSDDSTPNSTDTTTTATDTTGAAIPTPTPSSTSSAAYKDGTFTATGTYQSPAGPEGVTVSVTLKNGIITDSTVTSNANDGESRRYQSEFISGYKTYVNGKNIDSVSVGKVSGSSLTGAGFNNALTKIKAEAKA